MVTPQMAEMDAQHASAAAAIRGVQQPESVDGAGEVGCREGRSEPQAGSKDNPFLAFQEQVSKQIVACARQLARLAGGAERSDLPRRLRLAGAAGGGRHRSESEPSRRREMRPSTVRMLEKRIAELKSRIGEGGLREAAIRAPALCRIGAGHGRRAQPRGDAAAASRRHGSRRMTLPSSRCWCASSSSCCCSTGRRPRRHSEAVARRRRGTSRGLRRDPRGAVGQRRNHRRGAQPAEAGRRAVRRRSGEQVRASNVAPFDPKAKAS